MISCDAMTTCNTLRHAGRVTEFSMLRWKDAKTAFLVFFII
jgi:hypothetical protein